LLRDISSGNYCDRHKFIIAIGQSTVIFPKNYYGDRSLFRKSRPIAIGHCSESLLIAIGHCSEMHSVINCSEGLVFETVIVGTVTVRDKDHS